MINLNFRRIEYLRTKLICIPISPKDFSRLSAVRCAELSHDDRLHRRDDRLRCRELP
ncbi:hypothetical protein [uncultured Parabacteroides sp.]|uniref:hypothetical protein n=1 Tax=Parabacteroides sp. ASD2025 TaxID=3415987 RepID=UPI0025F6E0C6|nr:hypothetical protein [uncultured Parabacteroides sp.]